MSIFHLLDGQVLTFNHGLYVFPGWTDWLGWIVLSLLFVSVPLLAIITLFQASGKTIFQVIASLILGLFMFIPSSDGMLRDE